MKKILIAVLAMLIAISTIAPVTPARADNSEEVIIGVLGGALGGLIVGSAIGRRERVVEREYIYVEPEPVHNCYYKKIRFYDSYYGRWFVQKRRVCY